MCSLTKINKAGIWHSRSKRQTRRAGTGLPWWFRTWKVLQRGRGPASGRTVPRTGQAPCGEKEHRGSLLEASAGLGQRRDGEEGTGKPEAQRARSWEARQGRWPTGSLEAALTDITRPGQRESGQHKTRLLSYRVAEAREGVSLRAVLLLRGDGMCIASACTLASVCMCLCFWLRACALRLVMVNLHHKPQRGWTSVRGPLLPFPT